MDARLFLSVALVSAVVVGATVSNKVAKGRQRIETSRAIVDYSCERLPLSEDGVPHGLCYVKGYQTRATNQKVFWYRASSEEELRARRIAENCSWPGHPVNPLYVEAHGHCPPHYTSPHLPASGDK